MAIPILIGTIVGYGTRRRWRWASLVTGPDPAPRAWDYLFQGERGHSRDLPAYEKRGGYSSRRDWSPRLRPRHRVLLPELGSRPLHPAEPTMHRPLAR